MDRISRKDLCGLSYESGITENRMYQVERDPALPLSFAQNWLWISNQKNRSLSRCVLLGLRLSGQLDKAALRAALDRIVCRHEILRTTFRSIDGAPVQVIGRPDRGFVLLEHEIEADRNIEEIIQQEGLHRFDLFSGPLIRGHLLRLSEVQHTLLISQHPMISDRCSTRLFIEEFATLYTAFSTGRGDPLEPLELQYADYASWQRRRITEAEFGRQLSFWTNNLFGAPELLQLPVDRKRPSARLYAIERVQKTISSKKVEQVRRLAREEDVSAFVVLLSGWAALLARWSGQHELVIGTQAANGSASELGRLIGCFENTLALRVKLQDDPTAEVLLKRINSALLEASAHREVPFEQLIDALRAGGNQFELQMIVGSEETPGATGGPHECDLLTLKLSELDIRSPRSEIELALLLKEDQGALVATVEYAKDLFNRETIERIAACWQVLLEGMIANPQQTISRLPILTASEREKVLYAFNRTAVAFPQDRLIHELVEEQVQRKPDAIAVVCKQQSITYSELNSRANQLARHLRRRGLRLEDIVAVCVERSVDMVVGLLGVLKAGGAYMPLDPTYPAERLAFMLKDAMPRVLLTQQHLRKILPLETITEVVEIDSDWSAIAENDHANLAAGGLGLHARHLAYVIYTSGSTGMPKGAMNEHRGMVNRIVAQQNYEAFSEGDVCSQKTSISFVDAVFEIFGALCNGLRLVIVPAEAAHDSVEMAALIARERVTRLITVPSLAQSMSESVRIMRDLSGLRSWTLSGEEVRADLLIRLQQQLPNCAFIIQYGSSEVSSDAAIYKSRNFHDERTPLGRPIPNGQIYILDQRTEPVPIGVAGEIFVGGVGVGRGYLRRAELTAARFLPDRFMASGQVRLYKTGDLGRWRADGLLEYLGRADDQVKVRGFRIELGEIESQLLRHDQVREAVVVAVESAPGQKRLVAYVTFADESRNGEAIPTSKVEALRAHLKAVMPEYMIPAAFVVMERLPRTPNGKLNRRELPAPEFEAHVSEAYEAPDGEFEKILAEMWQEVLQLKRVGRKDHFFEVGGDSLAAMRLVVRVTEAFPIPFRAHSVFRSPTLKEMAQLVQSLVGGIAAPKHEAARRVQS